MPEIVSQFILSSNKVTAKESCTFIYLTAANKRAFYFENTKKDNLFYIN